LDPSTPWTELTNNYFANSTNRTTYTIVGAVPSALFVEDGGDTNLDTSQEMMSASLAEPTEPMATLADSTGPIVPLCLYPREFDMSRFLIYDPSVADWVGGAAYVRAPAPIYEEQAPLAARSGITGSGLSSLDSVDSTLPSTGFFRVFHIPDWSFNVTNYTYDGPWFFPVDFADYMDRIDNLKVLLNGVETDYAEFMSYDMGNG
jgi:hypothetical protein